MNSYLTQQDCKRIIRRRPLLDRISRTHEWPTVFVPPLLVCLSLPVLALLSVPLMYGLGAAGVMFFVRFAAYMATPEYQDLADMSPVARVAKALYSKGYISASPDSYSYPKINLSSNQAHPFYRALVTANRQAHNGLTYQEANGFASQFATIQAQKKLIANHPNPRSSEAREALEYLNNQEQELYSAMNNFTRTEYSWWETRTKRKEKQRQLAKENEQKALSEKAQTHVQLLLAQKAANEAVKQVTKAL